MKARSLERSSSFSRTTPPPDNKKNHDKINEGKGVLNNRISEYLFVKLGEIGVPTHFIKRLNMREQLIREVEIIPLEVVVRNVCRMLARHPHRRR